MAVAGITRSLESDNQSRGGTATDSIVEGRPETGPSFRDELATFIGPQERALAGGTASAILALERPAEAQGRAIDRRNERAQVPSHESVRAILGQTLAQAGVDPAAIGANDGQHASPGVVAAMDRSGETAAAGRDEHVAAAGSNTHRSGQPTHMAREASTQSSGPVGNDAGTTRTSGDEAGVQHARGGYAASLGATVPIGVSTLASASGVTAVQGGAFTPAVNVAMGGGQGGSGLNVDAQGGGMSGGGVGGGGVGGGGVGGESVGGGGGAGGEHAWGGGHGSASTTHAAREQFAASLRGMGGAGPESPLMVESEPVKAQVGRGLAQLLTGHGGAVTMRLNPGRLGEVRAQVEILDRVATIRLETTTSEARTLLERDIASLRASLESRGIEVASIRIEGPSVERPVHGETQGGAETRDESLESRDQTHDRAGDNSRGGAQGAWPGQERGARAGRDERFEDVRTALGTTRYALIGGLTRDSVGQIRLDALA